VGSGPLRRLRLAYDPSELFRRYFINTLFDSTFVFLGIVAASAILPDQPNMKVTLGLLGAAAIAVGVSSGVSVYEAERLEAEIRMAKLERAMLSELKDTDIHRTLRLFRTVLSLVNFGAPLLASRPQPPRRVAVGPCRRGVVDRDRDCGRLHRRVHPWKGRGAEPRPPSAPDVARGRRHVPPAPRGGPPVRLSEGSCAHPGMSPRG